MLDALVPAIAAAAGPFAIAINRAADAAAEGAARATNDMVPQHGRAGWLADRSMGHEDAGARLIAIILRAIADAINAETADR